MQLLLWQQGAQLLNNGVQLVLVAQPPAEELHVHPHRCADEPQLLRAHPGAYLHVPAPDEESVQGAVRLVQLRRVSKVVDDYKHLVQFLHFQLLGRLRDLALLLDDAPQRRLVPLVPIRLLPLCVHPQVPLNVLLDGDPAIVYVHTRAEDVNFLKTPRYCSRIRLIRATVLPDFDGPRKMPVHGTRGTTGPEDCLLLYSVVGNSLIFPISFALLAKFEAGKPGGESVSALLHSRTLTEFSGQSGRRVRECVSVYRRASRVFRVNQRAGMQLKYFRSKAWLAPHMDRLLGDVAVLHSPFFGSGKLEYYLAARRPGLEVRGVDAFEPVANLHRCYLRRDPVFLRSLLRLVGRRVDRRFYSGRLLPGALRGRAGRRAACGAPSHSSGRWH